MHVFRFLIADSTIESCDLSPPVAMAIQSVKDCFSDATHHLVQLPEIESFIAQHFDLSVLDLFVDSFRMPINLI